MAKSKKGKKGAKRQARAPRPRRALTSRLDDLGVAYGRLLADPCNAPVVRAPYPGGGGGFIARFELDGVWGYGATETGMALVFTPGALQLASGTSVLNAVCYNVSPYTTDTTTSYFTTNSDAPGRTFLLANSSGYRPVAACLEAYWPGTEQNRQGFLGVGSVPLSVQNAVSATPAQLRGAADLVTRMPDGKASINWRPLSDDENFRDPNTNNTTLGHFDEFGQVWVVATNLPVSTGIRVRMVMVVEWLPNRSIGMSGTSTSGEPVSRNSVRDVLGALDRAGRWTVGVAEGAMAATSSMVAAGQAVRRLGAGLGRLALMG